jgi:HK97 family phage major capsid protein
MDIRSHVVALNENRVKAHKALNDHLDACIKSHPGQPMSEEEKTVQARMNDEIDGLEAEIKRFVDQETREQDSAKVYEANAALFTRATEPKTQDEVQAFSDWARGRVRNADKNGQNYYEVPLPRNAIYTHVASGSLLVPTDLASTIYQYMTASVALMSMPTTKITTAGGNPLDFPKVVTHGIGTQVGEGTAIGGTSAVFGKVTLNAYKYGQLEQLSSETLHDDGVDILGFVASNVGRAVGEQIATALVTGSGSGAPNGIETSITNAAAPTGGTIHGLVAGVTYENLVDLVYSVNGRYRARPSTAFLFRDLTVRDLRKLRDGAGGTVGAVLWEPSLTQGIQGAEPDLLLGYPVWTDPNVASIASTKKVAYFGDWSAYYVRLAEGFRFERSDDFAFDKDMVTFRGLARVDGDKVDDNALNALRVV